MQKQLNNTESGSAAPPSVDLPRDTEKEEALQASLEKCSKEMHKVKTFQSDVVKQVNPNAKEIDNIRGGTKYDIGL